jgi:hypothetical protein
MATFSPVLPIAVGEGSTDTNLANALGELFAVGGKVYRLVKAGGTLAAEDIVVTAVASGVPSWVVADTTTANSYLCAGVIPTGTEALASGDYFLIQVSGVAAVTSAAAIAAGGLVGTSTTAGKADDATVAAGVGAIGVALESAAGADESVGILIKGMI